MQGYTEENRIFQEDTPLLEMQDAAFGYAPGEAICKGISLCLRAGTVHSLAGPSGAGKSTFLRGLVRLAPLLGGGMRLRGQDAMTMSPPALRREVLLVSQTPVLEATTVREALRAPWAYAVRETPQSGSPPLPGDPELRTHMERLGLVEVPLDAPVLDCSVGQQQRLCLLRAMLCDPFVLLLDEPFAPLDSDSAARVEAVLEDWVAGAWAGVGRAALVVSHQPWGMANKNIIRWRMDGGRFLEDVAVPQENPSRNLEGCCRPPIG